ncbi:MAG TPA: DNA-binding protein WhiA [Candidatus Dormibacteraeota bacterium]|nr:DNA-binding protein WhiA [Candidatus Dormibacteraeota bacterium]
MSELVGLAAAAPASVAGGELTVRLTRNSVARKVVRLARLLDPDLEEAPGGHYRRGATAVRPSYRTTIGLRPGTPLARLAEAAAPRAGGGGGDPVRFRMPPRADCRRAFLRGAFLATGVLSVAAGGYHMEIRLRAREAAEALAEALREMDAPAAVHPRRDRSVVYLKGSEAIATALAAMGASSAVLELENARILRQMRGQANRQANSETANLRRTVNTAVRQLQAVRALRQGNRLDALPPALREIAAVRAALPEASLQGLAEHLGLTKSAVNGRLRRLVEVAVEGGLLD